MKKIIAILLWPYVYFLDLLITLTGKQTFQESRAVTRAYFNKIVRP